MDSTDLGWRLREGSSSQLDTADNERCRRPTAIHRPHEVPSLFSIDLSGALCRGCGHNWRRLDTRVSFSGSLEEEVTTKQNVKQPKD